MKSTKRCAKCDTTKPASEFFKNRARGDGLSGYCKVCQQEVNSLNAQRQRQEVIDLLGGPLCKRCGFDDIRALVIDHIDGGGSQHRKDAVSLWGVYRHALAHPEEYQVLCANCNQIKRHEDGEWSSTAYIAKVKMSPRETLTKPVRWARDYDACTACKTTEVKHKSKGLCMNCYMRNRRTGSTEPIEDISTFRSQMMKARWEDPEERERLSEAISRGSQHRTFPIPLVDLPDPGPVPPDPSPAKG